VISHEIFLILHNIRSVFNVGSIFRTADAFGVKKIYLTGYTPDPAQKTALGAEKYVKYEKFKNIQSLIKNLKSEKFFIASLEQSKNSMDIKRVSKVKFKNFALILGNEVKGLPKSVQDCSDVVIEIPMQGKKESLNVSVATGIALYAIII
jgi:tRNA G18 (ribose-2'-O)-methylase SpoU